MRTVFCITLLLGAVTVCAAESLFDMRSVSQPYPLEFDLYAESGDDPRVVWTVRWEREGENYVVYNDSEDLDSMLVLTPDGTPVKNVQWDGSGEITTEAEYTEEQVRLRFRDDDGGMEDKTVRLRKIVYDMGSLFYIVGGLDFSSPVGTEWEFEVFWSVRRDTVGMKAAYISDESITLPAGRFDCHRVELGLDGLLGMIFDFRMNVWIDRTTKRFVKYSQEFNDQETVIALNTWEN